MCHDLIGPNLEKVPALVGNRCTLQVGYGPLLGNGWSYLTAVLNPDRASIRSIQVLNPGVHLLRLCRFCVLGDRLHSLRRWRLAMAMAENVSSTPVPVAFRRMHESSIPRLWVFSVKPRALSQTPSADTSGSREHVMVLKVKRGLCRTSRKASVGESDPGFGNLVWVVFWVCFFKRWRRPWTSMERQGRLEERPDGFGKWRPRSGRLSRTRICVRRYTPVFYCLNLVSRCCTNRIRVSRLEPLLLRRWDFSCVVSEMGKVRLLIHLVIRII